MTIAYQGRKKISSDDQLKALISQLAKSENFGLLLGSGASRIMGGSIMSEVWDNFKEKYVDSFEFLVREKILSTEDQNMNKNILIGQSLDRLTYILERSESYDGEMIEKANAVLMDLVRALVRAALLDENCWGQSKETLTKSEKLFHHKEVLRKISEFRLPGYPDPVVFTTNYDLAVEWAAKCLDFKIRNGFIGNRRKVFSQNVFRTLLDSRETGNEDTISISLIKLHGSLNWKQRGKKIEELTESEAIAELLKFIELEERSDIPDLMILPGGSMYVKTTEYPHKVLLNQFESFLGKPDTVLFVVGYGHCDSHIDEKIYSALSQNDELNLVIYYPELVDLNISASFTNSMKRIIELDKSNVVIIGGGVDAYFDAFSRNLPDRNFPTAAKIPFTTT